eukprot:COSAG05_NODE_16042_length_354_cov_30.937255_1_plen_60_part_01
MGVLINLPSTLSVGGVHARLNAALNLIVLSSTPYSRGIRRSRMVRTKSSVRPVVVFLYHR